MCRQHSTFVSSRAYPFIPPNWPGPSPVLTILAVELDSLVQVARLLVGKFVAMKSLVQSWSSRQWCTKWELESLICHLQHAAKAVWPGRTFLHRMIDLMCCFRKKDHPIWLNKEFLLGLQWWDDLLAQCMASVSGSTQGSLQVPLSRKS